MLFDLLQWTQAARETAGQWPLLIAGGSVVILLLLVVLRGREAQTSHGSARFGTYREAQPLTRGGPGFYVGTLQGKTLIARAQHVLLCGPSGTRKDRSHNLYTTQHYPHSMLILDAKDSGENYRLAGKYRTARGPVWRYTPAQRQSARYNLLDGVRWGQPEEYRDVSVIVEGLLSPTRKAQHSTDSGDYFRQSAINTLRAVVLCTASQTPGQAPHFPGILRQMAEAERCLAAMVRCSHPAVQPVGLRLQEMLRHSADKQFEGIWDTALRGLDVFQDPLIAAHSMASDFRLVDLQYGPTPTTLYLGAESPDDLLYLYPLYRAILQSTYHLLTSVPSQYAARRQPLTMLLNEFDVLGWMPLFEEAPARARAYQIWLAIVVQDLGQLYQKYGHDTPLLSNLQTQIFHTPVHDETARRLSERLSDTTVTVASRTMGRYPSRNTHQERRRLRYVNEVLGMSQEECLVWSQGMPHPLLVTKLPYWEG